VGEINRQTMNFSFSYGSDSEGEIDAIDDYSHMLGGDHEVPIKPQPAGSGRKLKSGDLHVTIAQREYVSEGSQDYVSVAVIPDTKRRLLEYLKEGQCFGIHYGHYSDEVPAMGKLLRAFNQSNVPKQTGKKAEYFCFDDKDLNANNGTISQEEIASTMIKGHSVICTARTLKQWTTMPEIIREIASSGKLRCSDVRVIAIIDRTGAFFIEEKIRDPRLDDVFGALDGTNSSNMGIDNFEKKMERCYDPQIMPSIPTSFDTLVGPWEGYMCSHQFRNST